METLKAPLKCTKIILMTKIDLKVNTKDMLIMSSKAKFFFRIKKQLNNSTISK